MLTFHRFTEEILPPVPAKEVYERHDGGQGWPEQCPPIRAANAFGFDVPLSHDLALRRTSDGGWEIEDPVEITADWIYAAPDGEEATPLVQMNAWFWDEGQTLPHPISPEVWPMLRNQVKVSTYLFLRTDPNELLLFTDVPHLKRPFRVLPALVDTDWYPASYPWHCVLELDPREERIVIPKGDPLCRLVPLKREAYFAREMVESEFETFFERGQQWLVRHGKGPPSGMMDITGAYGRLQRRASFSVIL
jgi:hypothetical protein